jgi:probable HAF family extracellular repeat protein
MQSLGTLGGETSAGWGVNSHGQIVGSSETEGFQLRPFVWTEETGMQLLPTLGGTFGRGEDINELGLIAGISRNFSERNRATLWKPTPGSPSDPD